MIVLINVYFFQIKFMHYLNRPSQLSAIIAPINGKKYARLVNTWNKAVASSFEYFSFPVKYNTSTAI